jgi:Fe-S-cluster containining protein
MTDPISPQSSDLCTDCGLCCSGPLFNSVTVAYDEIERAVDIGLPILADEDGPAIWFPCVKLVDKCCTVYLDRPTCCRTFRCTLLLKLDRDEIAIEDARAIVSDAWEAAHGVEAELAGETISQYRQRRAEALLTRSEALPHTPARDKLNELDAILDRHFRKPYQNQTTPFDEVEGRDGWISVTISRPSESDPPAP